MIGAASLDHRFIIVLGLDMIGDSLVACLIPINVSQVYSLIWHCQDREHLYQFPYLSVDVSHDLFVLRVIIGNLHLLAIAVPERQKVK
ncbi:hypothetical protein F5880DRAFT_1533054 [Lentinula raphanica]|nr:hypothetical protein F5880DRAFT_1533054 [Lentinula raphanica]